MSAMPKRKIYITVVKGNPYKFIVNYTYSMITMYDKDDSIILRLRDLNYANLSIFDDRIRRWCKND